jgi:FkbM family methyltransferase
MESNIKTIEDWVNNNGDYTHRLNYDLNENSIVFDLGGYEGWFTEQINNKYKSKIFCFEPIIDYFNLIKEKFIGYNNIIIFPLAVSNNNDQNFIYLNNDSTSMYVVGENRFVINCVTLDNIMKHCNLNKIDLIKINIEGAEYDLLDYMILNNLIDKCDNIQVQFHNTINDYESRYDKIKTELEKTHHLTYRYPFVWESWKKN